MALEKRQWPVLGSRLLPAILLSAGLLLALAATSVAGPLAVDGNALAGWSGTQHYSGGSPGFGFEADVDFAVFAPGDFELSYPAEDPSSGSEYVYAYQIFNQGPNSIGLLSVGMSGGIGEATFLAEFGAGQSPRDMHFAEPTEPYTSALFDFLIPSPAAPVAAGGNSTILLMTSVHSPHFDNSTVLDMFSLAGSGPLPSPASIPEPGTIYLLAIGAVLLLVRATRRRLHNRA